MSIKTIHSQKNGAEAVLADLRSQFAEFSGLFKPKMVLFFSTSNIEVAKLSAGMKDLFVNAEVFGCTTAGEIVSGHMLKDSVVVMLFDKSTIQDVKIEVVENISLDSNTDAAFKNFENYFSFHINMLDFTEYVGIVLIDGMSSAEEKLMDSISSNTNIHFIGGSAGDDLKFKETFVFANGKTYKDAAVLVLMKSAVNFGFIKTQSFYKTNRKLVATEVDEETREVISFDNKPAVKAYAEVLGVNPKDVENYFMSKPLAMIVEGDIYVRSPQKVIGNNIKFYCNIKQGAELVLLSSTDIVEDTKTALEKKLKDSGKISGIINFHCILRTKELEVEDRTDEYGKIFSDIPTIGFSTYGEEFFFHVNQTSTMLVFK